MYKELKYEQNDNPHTTLHALQLLLCFRYEVVINTERKMSEILCRWLNEDIQLTENVGKFDFQ